MANTESSDKLTITEHFTELQRRFIVCLIAVILGSVVSYLKIRTILEYFTKPVGNLVFLSPLDAFNAYLKLAFFCGLFLALPVILYQTWAFAYTGLKSSERKYLPIYGLFSYILFLTGISFAFFLILPVAVKFLLNFGSESLKPMISINEYISFAGLLLITFGLAFELPVVILFLCKINLVTPEVLRKKRKYVILLIFIVSAVLTPTPDAFTQITMAAPMILLYEISIVISILTGKKTKRH